jgi:hypothetical protein
MSETTSNAGGDNVSIGGNAQVASEDGGTNNRAGNVFQFYLSRL